MKRFLYFVVLVQPNQLQWLCRLLMLIKPVMSDSHPMGQQLKLVITVLNWLWFCFFTSSKMAMVNTLPSI